MHSVGPMQIIFNSLGISIDSDLFVSTNRSGTATAWPDRRQETQALYEEHDHGWMDGRHIPSIDDGRQAFDAKMEFRGEGIWDFEFFCSIIMNKHTFAIHRIFRHTLPPSTSLVDNKTSWRTTVLTINLASLTIIYFFLRHRRPEKLLAMPGTCPLTDRDGRSPTSTLFQHFRTRSAIPSAELA